MGVEIYIILEKKVDLGDAEKNYDGKWLCSCIPYLNDAADDLKLATIEQFVSDEDVVSWFQPRDCLQTISKLIEWTRSRRCTIDDKAELRHSLQAIERVLKIAVREKSRFHFFYA